MVRALRTGAAGGVMGAVGIYTGAFIAYFGGTAGISVLFGSVGAGLTGWRVARRTAVGCVGCDDDASRTYHRLTDPRGAA